MTNSYDGRPADPHALLSVLYRRPNAQAYLTGSEEYPNLHGEVRFYQTGRGTLVFAQVFNLPVSAGACANRVFGFHIHEGAECFGSPNDPLSTAGKHYNPGNCDHPHHAGDLPPLFGNGGYALSVVLTDRFTVKEIIGRTVIVHDQADDFTTQSSGNSGKKIACGPITEVKP